MTSNIGKASRLIKQALSDIDRTNFRQEIANLMAQDIDDTVITYETVKGHVLAYPLKHTDEVTVLVMQLSPDTIVRLHTHQEKEWIIVYEGTILSDLGDDSESVVVSEGESISFNPEQRHQVFTKQDEQAKCIVVTWPGSSDLI